MKRLRIAVVGVGNMGALHARAVAEHPGCELVCVVDPRLEQAQQLAARHATEARTSVDGLVCDAVIVAVPTTLHAEVALPMMRAGFPLLIEKPIAHTRDAMLQLLATSRSEQSIVMCGFIERFNPVITAVQSMLDGPVRHLIAQRHSPPADRIRSGVVGDLLIHDLDLALGMIDPDHLGPMPAVSGAIAPPLRNEFSDLADCTLRFIGGSVATLSAGRIGHRKVRQMSITTDTSLFEVDLLRQDLTVYHHVAHASIGVIGGYRSQTVVDIPFIRVQKEPLVAQLDHFCALVRGEADAETERRRLIAPHELAFALEALGSDEPLSDIDAPSTVLTHHTMEISV
jgi:predicted dehydrogenase